MKFYLLIFFFAYLVLTMFLPSWRTQKKTGKRAFVVPRDDSAAGFIGKIFKLLFLLVFIVLTVHAFAPAWEKYLLPADFLETKPIFWIGFGVLHFSLLFIIVAQWKMDRSWRVGFDESERTELITSGLFRHSRNPIFFGMLLTMLGLFLVLPNALSLVTMLLTYVVLQIQVRLEEEFLRKAQGGEYEKYMEKTPRWIGF